MLSGGRGRSGPPTISLGGIDVSDDISIPGGSAGARLATPAATDDTDCAGCGARLPGHMPVHHDGRRLCEHCYLTEAAVPAAGAGDVYTGFAEALVDALDLRERETGLHSRRVACHTLVLARHVGFDGEPLRQIYWGALLHDLGKIGVPDRVLLKAGPLDDAEWVVMRAHVEHGYHIVSRLPGMREAAEIVLAHEERYDGRGYPRGLRGEAIPFGARLFAVIDTLDAITSDRSYRRGQPFDVAREEITRMKGRQFDPEAVEAFLAEEAVLRHMVAMKCMQAQIMP